MDLSDNKNLLHVHHVNGVKSDNRRQNLKALCADCHRKQASHDHMFVDHKSMQTINRLRREQSIGRKGLWDEAIELADPAVEGVLLQCKTARLSVPEVGYEIQQADEPIVGELELAWPDRRIGVAIGADDRLAAEANGWEVWKMVEVLDEFWRFKASLAG